MTIEAKIILDSVGEYSPRLTTFLLRYNKYVHAEHCRHRSMSLCVSSSRAVPVSKNLEEVRSDELRAAPVWWGREQRGMSAAKELERTGYDFGGSLEHAQRLWDEAVWEAVNIAKRMAEIDVHKSIVNRLLEPFLHVNVLCTVAESGLMNFFGLRLDRTAQPEIRTLAEQMWACWGESRPRLLQPGEWHLPFVDKLTDWEIMEGDKEDVLDLDMHNEVARKISTACCARLSYTSFETGKRSTVDEDLALYGRLITSRPIHASPAEHQATPDEWLPKYNFGQGCWNSPELGGNFGPGWVQHRKLLPGEAVAELPEAYR